jgi:hypothetical protein
MDEMLANGGPGDVKVSMIARIGDALGAARCIASVGQDNGLSNHVQAALSNSPAYKAWLRAMPSTTPAEISKYQKNYENSDLSANEIEETGSYLSPGQCLFHGGLWSL